MNPGQPSRTAVRAALRRAAHQILDTPLLFADPLARQILGREVSAALEADPARFENQLGAPTLRAFLAVRSRIAEQALADAIARGARQYVVLGAGLDTFAYRHAMPHLRVFEVDEPATQAWKRARLADVGLAEPLSLTFVPADFESQALDTALRAAGFDPAQPAFFSWLGVTPYLYPPVVWATLQAVAGLTRAGGGITFDYAVPVESLNVIQRAKFAVLARRVAAEGEPCKGFFDPAAIARQLREFGFTTLEDLGPEALNARYFADRADGLSVGPMGHVVTATC